MKYKLPEDIRKIIYSGKNTYPFFKPEPFRIPYSKHLKDYKQRGFWESITWNLDEAIIQYINAALKLDNPNAVDKNGKNIIQIIENCNNMDFGKWDTFKEELIRNITTYLSQDRLNDLKKFLRLGLKWFKIAPINMYYHQYKDKPQEFWRQWLIERTYMNDDEALWSIWADVQYVFWW